jgi:hypothetical protein
MPPKLQIIRTAQSVPVSAPGQLGRYVPGLLAALVALLPACHSLGPSTIAHDRVNYSDAIGESWKDQVLRNLVKLRYMDTPIFLDVGQIVGGYTWQTSVNVGGQISTERAIQGNSLALGGQGVYIDRPTITYVPLTGERFLRNMVEPVPPAAIFRLMQSGYAADFVLALGVDNLNDLRNRSFRGGKPQPADPDFLRVLELLRQIQEAGGVGLRTIVSTNKEKGVVVVLRRAGVSEDILAKGREVRRLLNLPETGDSFDLVYSPLPAAPNELAVGSRSILQMMMALATYVEVPEAHLEQKRTVPMPEPSSTQPLLRVRCSAEKPADAFVEIQYRKHWFWVDDRDWNSKRTLSTMLFLFTLSDTGVRETPPLLTIPTQ